MVLRQLQEDAPFLNPIPVEIALPSGTRRLTLRPVGRETNLSLRLAERPLAVRLDPEETVLKEASVREANESASSDTRTLAQPTIFKLLACPLPCSNEARAR
jgi:hypothetical protein